MSETEHCGNKSPHHQHLYGPDDGLQYCKGTPYSPLPENVVMHIVRQMYRLFVILYLRVLIERLKRRRI